MEKEVWKSIPNYEGLYEVSNLGRVKCLTSKKEKFLKPSLNNYVRLVKNKKGNSFNVYKLHTFVFFSNIFNLKIL